MTCIKITVSPKGDTKVEASGYVGSTCADATAPYLARFGAKYPLQQLKPEYFQQSEQTTEKERA